MPTTHRPDNSIFKNNDNGFVVESSDQLIIDLGIVIASNFNGVYGNVMTSIACNGTIFGSTGLYASNGSVLTVGSSGTISGTIDGLVSAGVFNAVNNGNIFGGQTGIQLYGSATFTNTGTVISGSQGGDGFGAIYLASTHTYAKLTNTGLIQAKFAGGYGIMSFPDNTAPDTVINKGVVRGNVALSGGADVFDNLKGRVYGTIDTGAGADKITGGAFADTMTGGADKDTFYFKTKPSKSAIDHITDFTPGQDDIALSKALFKLDPGQSVASALQDITAGLDKQGSNKHILYNHDTGWLYYDKDGKGGAAPIHFATLDNHPTISSGDILMV